MILLKHLYWGVDYEKWNMNGTEVNNPVNKTNATPFVQAILKEKNVTLESMFCYDTEAKIATTQADNLNANGIFFKKLFN